MFEHVDLHFLILTTILKPTAGVVMINGDKTTVDYHLCNNDLLSHIVHRHELPVVGEQIKIVHQDDQSVSQCHAKLLLV